MEIPVKTLIAFLAVMAPALLRAQTVISFPGGVLFSVPRPNPMVLHH